jgi:CDP-paratose 2-epimerase
VKENRPADLKLFLTDCEKIKKLTGWIPKKNAEETIRDIADWINENKESLKSILS